MKILQVQLQPDLAPGLDVSEAKVLLESIASSALVSKFRLTNGTDGGPYLNFSYATENPSALWSEMKRTVLENSPLSNQLRQAIMVVCEGERGWHDYLQLYHFDPKVAVDRAGEL